MASDRRPGCAFKWLGSLDHSVAAVEVHTVLRATEPGTYTVGASGVGRYRLSVGGAVAFDEQLELRPGADIVEGLMVPPQATHDIELGAGEEVGIVLVHDVAPGPDEPGLIGVNFQLNLAPPHRDDDQEIEHASLTAGAADAVVLVVGTTEEVESEGFDRVSLSLPGRQDELVRRVAAANSNTVVVVNAGAPVLMPWAQDVAAVLLAWFPGQEFGNALADVLLGRAEPGGRLPTTWPATDAGLPSTRPVRGVLRYDEGLMIGYRDEGRGERKTLFPFGHGLGYSSWEYESIDVPARRDARVSGPCDRRGQKRRPQAQPRGRPALREPPRQRHRAAGPVARRVRGGRGGPGAARHRDDHRPAPGVRALERAGRRLGGRARHVRPGCRLLVGGAPDDDPDHGGMTPAGPDRNGALWWRSAVIYQVYIRSFADGDGDGIGDIPGLRSRLPYLAGSASTPCGSTPGTRPR